MAGAIAPNIERGEGLAAIREQMGSTEGQHGINGRTTLTLLTLAAIREQMAPTEDATGETKGQDSIGTTKGHWQESSPKPSRRERCENITHHFTYEDTWAKAIKEIIKKGEV